jgi:hypothetical protein
VNDLNTRWTEMDRLADISTTLLEETKKPASSFMQWPTGPVPIMSAHRSCTKSAAKALTCDDAKDPFRHMAIRAIAAKCAGYGRSQPLLVRRGK